VIKLKDTDCPDVRKSLGCPHGGAHSSLRSNQLKISLPRHEVLPIRNVIQLDLAENTASFPRQCPCDDAVILILCVGDKAGRFHTLTEVVM
jgi:hypothetical protein